jgi:hypothetical protein
MKQIINHINKAALSIILISAQYSGETIADTFLNYCLDRLFSMFIRKAQHCIRPVTIIVITFGILFTHQSLHANCAYAKKKSGRLYPTYAKVKIIVDLEKRRDGLHYYGKGAKRNLG